MSAPALEARLDGIERPPFQRVARATLGYTVFVILFGAVVRITGSGAGCGQHWPTCNGEIAHLPRTLHTAIELTHRVTSGLALVAVLGLSFVAFRSHPPGHRARKLAVTAVLLTLLEALIGAGLVLLALVARNSSAARALVMPAHLLSTYALTGVLTVATRLGPDGETRLARPVAAARALLVACGVGLVLVSATGAVTALGDTLYPPRAASLAARLSEDQGMTAHFLMRLRVVHPVLAVLVAGLLAYAAPRIAALSTGSGARRAARAVVGLAAAQVAAGVTNVLLSAPGWLQVGHLALALGLWIAFVVLACEALARASARFDPGSA